MFRKASQNTLSLRRTLQLESLEIRQTMTASGWGDDLPSSPSPLVATVLAPNIELQTSNANILKSSLGKSVVDPSIIVERLIAEENAKATNVGIQGNFIDIQGTEDNDRITVSDLPDGKVLIEVQSFPTTGKGINQRFVAQIRRDTDASGIWINAKGGNDTVTTRTTVHVAASGGEGNDRLESTSGRCSFSGDNGNDTLIGGLHADILEGGTGHNWLEGRGGDDTLDASSSYGDVLVGGDNDDTLIGSLYADELYGGDGKDRLQGRDCRGTVDLGSLFD